MSSIDPRELDAYYSLFNTYSLPKEVNSPGDLSDGVALWSVLSSMYVVCLSRFESVTFQL
jgi:hypothetical protein